jgi:hypothetical protein
MLSGMRLPIALIAAVSAGCLACCGEAEPAEPAPPSTGPAWAPSDDPTLATFVGLAAPKPEAWTERRPSGMGRVANYTVPGGDESEVAEIVVYFFGRGQGGGVEDNVDRWQGQFRPGPHGAPPEPIVEQLEVGGMTVTLVELAGDWMPIGRSGYAEDQLFLAAIVEAPAGRIFIRFAGPRDTVEADREAFMQMVKGLRPAEPPT